MLKRRDAFSRVIGGVALGGVSRALTAIGAGVGGATMAAGATVARADAQAAGTLNRVLKGGTIRIATIGGNPPWSGLTPAGNPEGYDVDIGNQIAKDLKVKAQFVVTDVPGRIAVLQTGKADITIADFTNTVERSTVIAFTDAYVLEHGEFLVLNSRHDLQKVADLNKPAIKLGAVRGATEYDEMPPFAPAAQIKVFNTETDKYLALDSGQVDAIGGDNFKDAAEMQKSPGKYRILGTFSTEEIGIGLPAGDFDWWRVLNVWGRQFTASGLNARLFQKWFKIPFPALRAS